MADKSRYFSFLVYPDSAPEDWRKSLKDSFGSFAISPLHTPGNGEKPHHHVIYKHSNTCSLDCAKSVIPVDIPANGKVIPVSSPRNYQRYLIHLDDPEKQQFLPDDIEIINGFPLDLSRDFSKTELQQFRSEIHEVIRTYNFVEYCDLLDYLHDSGKPDLYDYASNHTILFNTYISSRRNKAVYMSEE